MDVITSHADLDEAGIDVDLATWKQALIAATLTALKFTSGLSVSSLSLDQSDPVNTIEYRPHWLADRSLWHHYGHIAQQTMEIVNTAVDIVAKGYYRPEIKFGAPDDEAIWPMANVIWMLTEDGIVIDPEVHDYMARVVLATSWSSIQNLAVEVCRRTRLSAFEVWDIIQPGTTKRLRADAFHLAGRAVASSVLGISPTYLSIFNFRDQGIEYFEEDERQEPLSFEEREILAFAGPVASMSATGTMVIDQRDVRFREMRAHATRNVLNPTSLRNALAGEIGPRVEQFLKPHATTIGKLANLLLREYCLIEQEITYVLDGRDIKWWGRAYPEVR